MRSFPITFLVIAAQLLFSQNLQGKTYLGVTLPFASRSAILCEDKYELTNRFDGKCFDGEHPSEFGGYSIFFGGLNFGLFQMIKELRYGSEKRFEWKMKSEFTGLYLGFYHSYGWNFVISIAGEGKSNLSTKESPIYVNSGETKTGRILTTSPKITKSSDCSFSNCMFFAKFGWPISERLQLLFQLTSLEFGDKVQYLQITDEEYQKRGSRLHDRFHTFHYFYSIGIAYYVF